MDDKIEKIKSISSGEKSNDEIQPIDKSPSTIEVDKDHFQSLMMQERNKEAIVATNNSNAIKKPSLMEEVGNLNSKVNSISRSNPKDLSVQADNLVAQIDELKTKLSTPNLELKSSVQNLLRNKLTHIDESLKIALSKAGVEYNAPKHAVGASKPIERFLGFLTDAQYQLQNLGHEVQVLGGETGQLSPASMLAIQIKVGYVTQEIEFFTSLLNKALESTKTIMNVQV
jgi:hypothetical protein